MSRLPEEKPLFMLRARNQRWSYQSSYEDYVSGGRLVHLNGTLAGEAYSSLASTPGS